MYVRVHDWFFFLLLATTIIMLFAFVNYITPFLLACWLDFFLIKID